MKFNLSNKEWEDIEKFKEKHRKRRIVKELVDMKEFGKRLIVFLTLPLWIVIHFVWFAVFVYIIIPVTVVIMPFIYLFIGKDILTDWLLSKFDYFIKKHDKFITKIKRL